MLFFWKSVEYNIPTSVRYLNVKTQVKIYAELYGDIQKQRIKSLYDNKIDAEDVEYGTRPHTIKPKNKQALHWKEGNTDVFAKEVHHPGTKAKPFFEPAVKKNEDKLDKDLDKLIERISK